MKAPGPEDPQEHARAEDPKPMIGAIDPLRQ
jgi:hypothetical protein